MARKQRDPNDRVVWVTGDNGITVPRWTSTLKQRMDLKIEGEWYKGDKCPNDKENPNNPAYVKPTVKKAAASKPATTTDSGDSKE